jgi:hypothetical protein
MAAHTAPTRVVRHHAVSWSAVFDQVTYWAGIGAVYIAYGFLWYYAAKEKLFDQDANMPAGLAKAYSGTFIDSFPGVDAAWLLLGLLEAAAFLVVIASLATGEFLPQRSKPILLAAMAVSMFTFAVMAFAQNMIAEHDSVASLFTYMGVTAVIYALLRYVPPFRAKTTAS